MRVLDRFQLIKDIPNCLDINETVLEQYEVEIGTRKLFVFLEPHKKRISHFTKDVIFDLIINLKKREILKLVNLDIYPLAISYNKKTDNIIINLDALGSKDLERINFKTVYAALAYGICFYRLVAGKYNIDKEYARNISDFIASILIHIFGKAYGLIGLYSFKIPKLKFFINKYILTSFFDLDIKKSTYIASSNSNFDGTKLESQLTNYDFTSIRNFITSLNDFDIMPGINANIFVSKIYSKFGYTFLAALEDCSRFFATIVTADIKGSNVVPVFIDKYNQPEFSLLLEVCKNIFRNKF